MVRFQLLQLLYIYGSEIYSFIHSKTERNAWCNLIKRRENKDGFRITKSTQVCEKHFLPSKIYRPTGGRKRLIQGARPILHPWNYFTQLKSIEINL